MGWVIKAFGWLKGNLTTVAIIGLVSYTGVLHAQKRAISNALDRQEQLTLAMAIRADSAEAAADTTRLIGDQYRRRAIQAEVERDSLATELQERPVVRTQVLVESPPVEDTVSLPQGIDIPRLVIDHEDANLAMRVTVEHPRAIIQYQLKPISLTVGVRCGEGVEANTALITVEPENRNHRTQISDARVDPGVCNPVRPGTGRGGGSVRSFLGGAATALLVALAFL